MSYLLKFPAWQYFCTQKLIPSSAPTTTPHSFSKTVPFSWATRASQCCIPRCKILSCSQFVFYFPAWRRVLLTVIFIYFPLTSHSSEIIHYNLLQPCPMVASHSTWMLHHKLCCLLQMYWEETPHLEIFHDNKSLFNFILLNDWK